MPAALLSRDTYESNCRTRLKLVLDANDIRNCKESSLFFLDVYSFLICCTIIEQKLSQNLVNFKKKKKKLKQFQTLFPCFQHWPIFVGLQPHFFFGKYFHSRVAVGRTPRPKPPVVKLSKRANCCQMQNVNSRKLEAAFSSVFFWHNYLRHFL